MDERVLVSIIPMNVITGSIEGLVLSLLQDSTDFCSCVPFNLWQTIGISNEWMIIIDRPCLQEGTEILRVTSCVTFGKERDQLLSPTGHPVFMLENFRGKVK